MVSKKLDIIVPVFNQEPYIYEFLSSIKDFGDENLLNVILVNDGSTDKTLDIIDDFLSDFKLNHIKVFSKVNGGAASARNFGLKLSTAEYIWFCDPDDLILPNISNVLDELIENVPDILAFPIVLKDDKSGEEYRLEVAESNLSGYQINGYFDSLLKVRRFSGSEYNSLLVFPWDKIIRRNIIIDCFDDSLSVYEDQLFNFNLFTKNKDASLFFSQYAPYKHVLYEQGTLSTNWNSKKTNDFCIYFNSVLPGLPCNKYDFLVSEVIYIHGKKVNISIFKLFLRVLHQTHTGFFSISVKNHLKILLHEFRVFNLLKSLTNKKFKG